MLKMCHNDNKQLSSSSNKQITNWQTTPRIIVFGKRSGEKPTILITEQSHDEKRNVETTKTQEDTHDNLSQKEETNKRWGGPGFWHWKGGTIRIDTQSRIPFLVRVPEVLFPVMATHLPFTVPSTVPRILSDCHSQWSQWRHFSRTNHGSSIKQRIWQSCTPYKHTRADRMCFWTSSNGLFKKPHHKCCSLLTPLPSF